MTTPRDAFLPLLLILMLFPISVVGQAPGEGAPSPAKWHAGYGAVTGDHAVYEASQQTCRETGAALVALSHEVGIIHIISTCDGENGHTFEAGECQNLGNLIPARSCRTEADGQTWTLQVDADSHMWYEHRVGGALHESFGTIQGLTGIRAGEWPGALVGSIAASGPVGHSVLQADGTWCHASKADAHVDILRPSQSSDLTIVLESPCSPSSATVLPGSFCERSVNPDTGAWSDTCYWSADCEPVSLDYCRVESELHIGSNGSVFYFDWQDGDGPHQEQTWWGTLQMTTTP